MARCFLHPAWTGSSCCWGGPFRFFPSPCSFGTSYFQYPPPAVQRSTAVSCAFSEASLGHGSLSLCRLLLLAPAPVPPEPCTSRSNLPNGKDFALNPRNRVRMAQLRGQGGTSVAPATRCFFPRIVERRFRGLRCLPRSLRNPAASPIRALPSPGRLLSCQLGGLFTNWGGPSPLAVRLPVPGFPCISGPGRGSAATP